MTKARVRFTIEMDEEIADIIADVQRRFGVQTKIAAIIRCVKIADCLTKNNDRVFIQNGTKKMKEIVFL